MAEAAPMAGQALDPAAAGFNNAAQVQGYNQSAEFFLSNYRLGKTLGIGSFGKVRVGAGLQFRAWAGGHAPEPFCPLARMACPGASRDRARCHNTGR